MSSDPLEERAAQAVAAMRHDLDPQRIVRLIDEPIDRALADFRFERPAPLTRWQFHRLIAGFVAYLHAHGVAPARRLTPDQAAAEAVALLEVGYQGTHECGYDGAYLDALTPAGSGIDSVLARLAEIIRARRRYLYRQWVLARHIDPRDWPLRCAISALLLGARLMEGDPTLAPGRAEQFAGFIPELLDGELSTATVLDQLLANAIRGSR